MSASIADCISYLKFLLYIQKYRLLVSSFTLPNQELKLNPPCKQTSLWICSHHKD